MWELYDAILDGLPQNQWVKGLCASACWSLAETDAGGCGIAMTTPFDARPPLFPGGLAGRSVREAAGAVKSWNLTESGFALAAANAFYNTAARVDALQASEPYDNYCTAGLDLTGRTVGVVGHLKMPPDILQPAKQVYILERHPQAGDYPDSACDFLLPACDLVLITGSTLVNKTLPHLLELCRDACVILTGPSVPLCPALLELGVDRLAGMAVTDKDGMRRHVEQELPGPPFPYGGTFLLKRG